MDTILKIGPEDPKYKVFLSKLGHSLVTVEDTTRLEETLSSHIFDLIVVDTRCDMDAIALCEFLREAGPTKEIPILYLYEHESEVTILKNRLKDRIEFLSLPYRIGTLAGQTATMLRLRKFSAHDAHASLGEVNAMLRELNEEFTRQLEEARLIQQSLIPRTAPSHPAYDIAVTYRPLEEVGGDWYYFHETARKRLAIQIADVTGHGLSAAFIGCMTKLAMEAAEGDDPGALLTEVNRLLSSSLPEGRFVTMFSCNFDPESKTFAFARAGHPPALLLRGKSREIEELKGSGFAIGFLDDSTYESGFVTLEKGDAVVLFTDAIPESQNLSNEMYEYKRVSKVLSDAPPEASAQKLLDLIMEDFTRFCDGRIIKDDVTVVLLTCTG